MEIGGKICRIIIRGADLPTIYWGVMKGSRDTSMKAVELCGDLKCNFVIYEADDWNTDFSPWEFTLNQNMTFSGGGRKMLDWLTGECLPYCEREHGLTGKRILCGYSLSGLFSLWAFYESGAFSGVISCSGSLWYSGWKSYAASHSAPAGSTVYLSLGDREERARDRTMAAVGDCTRQQYELMRKDANISRLILHWEQGGHFSDPEKRIAGGIFWTIAAPVLDGIPFTQVTAKDVRRYMAQNTDEKSLAEAYSLTAEKAAAGGNEEWSALEKELREGILSIMESRGYLIPSKGQTEVLKPFMLKNGYIWSRNGWKLPK